MNGTADRPAISGFGHQVEREIPRLRRYARALTRDYECTDDLVQTCLTRALAKQHLWRPATDLRAWLFTILNHSRVNELRRAASEEARREIAATLLTPAASQPDNRVHLCDLDRATAKLPPYHPQILLPIALQGMSYTRVAAILGMQVGTVRSRLGRTRSRLRAELGRPAAAAKRYECSPGVAPV